jgi:carboxypeptidase T
VLAWPTPPPARVAIRVPDGSPAAQVALDVWSEHRAPGMPLEIVVDEHVLDALDVDYELIDPDIDATARAERARLALRRPGDWFADYRDFTEITSYMRTLQELAPDRVQMHEIGRSLEGRALWALRIGNGNVPMLVNGTQHAREWIATMVTACVADRMVRDYDRDPRVRAFVDSTELWVVPVVNPDGYQHSWSSDRYWRKNRRGPHGVDLNRNFSVAWGQRGSSGRERAEDYRGKHAFSEPESIALRQLTERERFALHVDFHAFGQLVLHPWCYTQTKPQDRDKLRAIGDRMASAIYSAHEKQYRLMSGAELYAASGTMSDWMYGEAKATSFTIELRPSRGGLGGFVLPPEQIKPTCDEAFAAVLALRASHR